MNSVLFAAYIWAQVVVPGKTAVQAFGINDRGQMVVTTDDGTSGVYGHGHFAPLPAPPASCGCNVAGVAVNDRGVVTGIAFVTATGLEEGFILADGQYSFFSWSDYPNTEPRGLNNQGLVVGWGWNGDTYDNAGFLYDPSSGTFTNVTPGSGYPAITQGINNRGLVAGTYIETRPRRLFGLVTQPNAKKGLPFQDRIQLQGRQTKARGINDFGLIVLDTNTPDGGSAGFVGSDTWGYEQLIPPGGDAPGNATFCTGLNNLGQVACSVSDVNFSTTLGLYIGTPAEDQDRDGQDRDR